MPDAWPACSFAFQPIVNVAAGNIVAYEALVRGRNREPAAQVLSSVNESDRYHFDESLRQHAIALASRLGLRCNLSLNLLPHSLELSEHAVHSTLDTAARLGIACGRISLEIIESEIIGNLGWFVQAINEFRALGVHVAIDDFGAGYSGLNLLASFQPDSIKIDMSLLRNVDASGPKQAIVRGIIRCCLDLGIDIVAEGIESEAEFDWCRAEGIGFGQGFYVARPGFEALPPPVFGQVA